MFSKWNSPLNISFQILPCFIDSALSQKDRSRERERDYYYISCEIHNSREKNNYFVGSVAGSNTSIHPTWSVFADSASRTLGIHFSDCSPVNRNTGKINIEIFKRSIKIFLPIFEPSFSSVTSTTYYSSINTLSMDCFYRER